MPKVADDDFMIALEVLYGQRPRYDWAHVSQLGVTLPQLCKLKQNKKWLKCSQKTYEIIQACLKHRETPHLPTLVKIIKARHANPDTPIITRKSI